ncbi:MAG: ComF family protein [Bacteroidetes bacterium]|nr:ComF family protein [Bacteroidota bacterium]
MFTHAFSKIRDLSHLFFPHNCLGCFSDVLSPDQFLCAACFFKLPETGFFKHPENAMEKIFYGRLPVQHAGSAYYFNHDSILHRLVIQFKYQGRKDIGDYLGKLLCKELILSMRYDNLDAVIAMPLNKAREKIRGFNQSSVLAKKIAQSLQIPLLENVLERKINTQSQTTKGRIARWENMQNNFIVIDPKPLENKHILLVDDIITTGATLEACGMEILKTNNSKLSIATLGFTV